MMQDNTRASSSPTFPAHELRAQFPALKHAGNFVFFDNAAGAQVYGISDPERAARRVPTICFNLPGVDPAKATQVMADAGIGVRDGHLYAPRLMRHFGLDLAHGAIRISLVHYNTVEEIDRFAQVLRKLR